MIADTPIAEVHPSLGYRKRKYEQRRRAPVAIVIHTTGGGPLARLTEAKFATWRRKNGFPRDTFESAIRVYQTVSEAGPHYVIGQELGQIAQLAPESECAWHVGGKGGAEYKKPRARWLTRAVEWWDDEFPELESPRQLAGEKLWLPYGHKVSLRVAWNQWLGAGSVNANTIGIEVACPSPDPRGEWSIDAWANLVELVGDVAARHSIPIDREHIVSHSEAHPIARSTNGKPWDTNDRQFTWERFAALANV